MCAQKHEDQGTITLSQMDYLPIVIESFLIDRRSQGLSDETIKFYKKKLNYFVKFCESQAVTQVGQLTQDLLRRYLLELGEAHNPGGVHACFRTLRTLLLWVAQEEIMPLDWRNPIRKVKAPNCHMNRNVLEDERMAGGICRDGPADLKLVTDHKE